MQTSSNSYKTSSGALNSNPDPVKFYTDMANGRNPYKQDNPYQNDPVKFYTDYANGTNPYKISKPTVKTENTQNSAVKFYTDYANGITPQTVKANATLKPFNQAEALSNSSAPVTSADTETQRIVKMYQENAKKYSKQNAAQNNATYGNNVLSANVGSAQVPQSTTINSGFDLVEPEDEKLKKYYSDLNNTYNSGMSKYGEGAFGTSFDKNSLADEYLRNQYNIESSAYSNALKEYQSLTDQYNTQQKSAAEQRRQEYINQELFKSTLPVYLKSQGLGGLGVSQSTLTQLEGDYRNRIAGINTNNDSMAQKYLDYYNQNYQSAYGAGGTVSQDMDLLKDEYAFELKENYEKLMREKLNPNGGYDKNALMELNAFLNKNKKNMHSEDYAKYVGTFNSEKNEAFQNEILNAAKKVYDTDNGYGIRLGNFLTDMIEQNIMSAEEARNIYSQVRGLPSNNMDFIKRRESGWGYDNPYDYSYLATWKDF